MGLLRMLGLVRLSEYEVVCEVLDETNAALCLANDKNAQLWSLVKEKDARWLAAKDSNPTAEYARLRETNGRLAAKVSELEELLERKGHPLSWPSVTEPEPATLVTNWLEADHG